MPVQTDNKARAEVLLELLGYVHPEPPVNPPPHTEEVYHNVGIRFTSKANVE